MEKAIETLENSAKELDKMAASTNVALTEMRVQFETLASMQQEERLQIQKMHHDEISKIIERNDKQIAHWKHIVVALVLVITLFVGGLIGTAVYVFTNFEFGVFTQDNSIGGDGNTNLNDGIHINTNGD